MPFRSPLDLYSQVVLRQLVCPLEIAIQRAQHGKELLCSGRVEIVAAEQLAVDGQRLLFSYNRFSELTFSKTGLALLAKAIALIETLKLLRCERLIGSGVSPAARRGNCPRSDSAPWSVTKERIRPETARAWAVWN